jgi:DNA-binding MarR family transcriptional regulator
MTKHPLSILPEDERPEPALDDSVPTKIADLNRIIHEPARLAILTVLSACHTADFTFVQTATGLTKGNLSVQLTRLEEAGLISTEKTIERKRTLTTAALTAAGQSEFQRYWRQLERIRAQSIPQGAPATTPAKAR